MEILYRDSKIREICTDIKKAKIKHGELAERIHLRIKQLIASNTLKDAFSIRSMGLHQLKGERSNEYAVTLNGNYRLIFTPIEKNNELKEIRIITIEEIIDYH